MSRHAISATRIQADRESISSVGMNLSPRTRSCRIPAQRKSINMQEAPNVNRPRSGEHVGTAKQKRALACVRVDCMTKAAKHLATGADATGQGKLGR